jgi:hypothetical protein
MLAWGALAAGMAQPDLCAQTVQGMVTDEAGRALIDVRVTLLGEGDSVSVASGVSGFAVRAPRPGRYRLRGERIGYAVTTTEPFQLAADQVLNVRLRLGLEAVPLEPLRVEAASMRPLHLQDIDERRRQGFGRFITREDIERRPGAIELPELLADLPGVRVVNVGAGHSVVQMRSRSTLEERPYSPRWPEYVNSFIQANQCPVTYYLNGMKVARNDDLRHVPLSGEDENIPGELREVLARNRELMQLTGAEIDVVEVYSGAASVPGFYGGSDAECGVIAIWTRRGPDALEPQRGGGRFSGARAEVAAVALAVRGAHAAGRGSGGEAVVEFPLGYHVQLGARVQASRHTLSAPVTDSLTASVPGRAAAPGARRLLLWTAGVHTALSPLPDARVRPALRVRVQTAHRSFNPFNRDGANAASRGWGVGAAASVETLLNDRIGARASLGVDRLRLGGYHGLTGHGDAATTWTVTTLAVGLTRVFRPL